MVFSKILSSFGRTAPRVVALGGVSAATYTALSVNTAQADDERAKANAEILKHSNHTRMEDLVSAGEKRRAESNCSFCAWMSAGPCGSAYKEWDNCVNETKKIEDRDFVEVRTSVCIPTLQAEISPCIFSGTGVQTVH